MTTGIRYYGMSQFAKCSDGSPECLLNRHVYLESDYKYLIHISFTSYSTVKRGIQNLLVRKPLDIITVNMLKSERPTKLLVSVISEI
jgi:hypothetical protein